MRLFVVTLRDCEIQENLNDANISLWCNIGFVNACFF